MTIIKCNKKKEDDFETNITVETDDMSKMAFINVSINGVYIKIRSYDEGCATIEVNSIDGKSSGNYEVETNSRFNDIHHHMINIKATHPCFNANDGHENGHGECENTVSRPGAICTSDCVNKALENIVGVSQ